MSSGRPHYDGRTGRWRLKFAPVISAVLDRHKGELTTECKRALRRAWRDDLRMGAFALWPYKVWRDEIARQTGRTQGRITRHGKALGQPRGGVVEHTGQRRLFMSQQGEAIVPQGSPHRVEGVELWK